MSHFGLLRYLSFSFIMFHCSLSGFLGGGIAVAASRIVADKQIIHLKSERETQTETDPC
jgi:hypothetical protein